MAQKDGFIVKHKKDIIVYVLLFVTMLILNRSNIMGIKMPLASAFAFSLIFLNKNVFIVALSFFVSFIVYDISFSALIIAINVVSALLLLYLLFKIFNKKITFASTLVACLLGQVGYIYYHLNGPAEMLVSLVTVSVSLMFLYVCSQAFSAVFYRGLQSRFTIDESICFGIFLIALSSGIGSFYILNINITNMIVFFVILIFSKTFSKTNTIFVAALIGAGVSFSLGSIVNIAVFVSWSLVCVAFRDKHKLFSAISVIFLDLVFGYFFNVYAYYSYINILSMVCVSIFFLCIPTSVFSRFRGYSYEYEGSLADEYIVSGQRVILKNKIIKISELFSQIQNAYRNLSIGELKKENVANVLTEETVLKYCKNCPNYYNCVEREEIKKSINQLFEFGLEKGKINIIDANNLITSECKKLTGLINVVNNNLEDFWSYEKTLKTEDSNKMVVAEQFAGTSAILKELSNFVVCGEKINYKVSKTLLDELTLNKVVVNEALVLESNQGVEKIVLIIRNEDVLSANINLSLKSIFKINFNLDVCKMTRFAGWSVLSFSPAPRHDIVIGFSCSSRTPDTVSGDNYSIVKLGNNKVLLAISDGMGHGKRANEISNVALNLIESFYRAGFSSEIVLSSVNRILLPAGEENFTTLDACVFDKNDATVDFIKVGATCSVIKGEETSRLITQDGLPLGILDNINIKAKKYILKDNDIVVLASDGVVDSFSNFEEFLNYINNERVINVQMLADSILEEAESRDNQHRDDKTVITFKVNAKV